MQATKIRLDGFQRLLLLIVTVSILAGAIVFAAFSREAFSSPDRDPQVIERSAPVSRPSSERWLGFPDRQATPSNDVHRPTDRP